MLPLWPPFQAPNLPLTASSESWPEERRTAIMQMGVRVQTPPERVVLSHPNNTRTSHNCASQKVGTKGQIYLVVELKKQRSLTS
mmetsp:Transcript_14534/g.18982  ORF Transcript_14534/g.18982 Transcript_14534/m.18982 type:complete len:84 (-) Transcript_14534:268-519(-)